MTFDIRSSLFDVLRFRPLCLVLALWLPAQEGQAQGGSFRPSTYVADAAISLTNTTAVMPASSQPMVASGITLSQAWQYGGWIMWLLLAMAVFGAVLMVRQLVAYCAPQVLPRGLLTEVLDRVRAGDLGEARRLCEDRPSPLSAIALKAFDQLRHAHKSGVSLLRDTVEAEVSRQVALMSSHVQLLLDIAVIALMLGLLGTVLGSLQIYGPAATDPAVARVALQTGGIVPALVTTAFGLLVAIPAMVCHVWLRCRTVRQTAALKSAATEIVVAVVGRYDR